VCFVDIRQHLTLSVLAHSQNGDQQKTSNTDDERVSKFQLQRPSQKKISLRYFVTTSATLINCTLVSGNPVRARASLLWRQPACARNKYQHDIVQIFLFIIILCVMNHDNFARLTRDVSIIHKRLQQLVAATMHTMFTSVVFARCRTQPVSWTDRGLI